MNPDGTPGDLIPIKVVWDEDDSDVLQIYPVNGRPHETGRGAACWCGPRYFRYCTQCDRKGCWACLDGLIETDGLAPGDRGAVLHNAPGFRGESDE